MKSFLHRTLLVLLILSVLCAALPVNSEAAGHRSKRTMDDAMLLMIASGYRLMMPQDEWTAVEGGGVRMLQRFAFNSAASKNPNEIEAYAAIYADLHMKYDAKAAETLTGDQAERVRNQLADEGLLKINRLLSQAEKLRAQRRRRRRGGIFRVFRRIGQRIGRVFVKLANAIGKGTRFLVTEVGPAIAKEMVMERLRSINAMLQGRIDHFWERVRGRLGPWTEVLRIFVDKAFVRERDRLTAKLGLRAQSGQQNQPQSDLEPWPDFDSEPTGPEGEGGYDEVNCGDNSWIADHMTQIRQALVEEGKNCQETAIMQYQACLYEHAQGGKCEGEVLYECEQTLSAIPPNLPGDVTFGTANIQSDYRQEREETFEMTLSSTGGAVKGTYVGVLVRTFGEGADPCTITITSEFSGTFDSETCIASGNETETLELSEEGIHSACYTMGCDFGHEGCTRNKTWALMLKDDHFECTTKVENDSSLCVLHISLPK